MIPCFGSTISFPHKWSSQVKKICRAVSYFYWHNLNYYTIFKELFRSLLILIDAAHRTEGGAVTLWQCPQQASTRVCSICGSACYTEPQQCNGPNALCSHREHQPCFTKRTSHARPGRQLCGFTGALLTITYQWGCWLCLGVKNTPLGELPQLWLVVMHSCNHQIMVWQN